jgi:hypothetical protein
MSICDVPRPLRVFWAVAPNVVASTSARLSVTVTLVA